MIVFWTAVSVIGGWFVLVNAYVSVMHAKLVLERGDDLHWLFRIPIAVLGIIGIAVDVLFNFTVGVTVFGAIPKQWTFSATVQYNYRFRTGRDRRRARWWAVQLNKFDHDHITKTDGTPVTWN